MPEKIIQRPFISAFLSLALGAASSAAIALDDLGELRWTNRIILLDARGKSTNFATDMKAADIDIVDRDILWFILDESGITTNYTGMVSSEFTSQIRDEYFDGVSRVVLVGKDGGIKYRQESLELPDIFVRIDAMPMRQQEMLDKAN